MPMRNIVIYGCGGFGREVLQVIHAINAEGPTWNVLGFAVDPGIEHPETVHGLPVTSDLSTFGDDPLPDVVIAIGSPAGRKGIATRLGARGHAFPALVHPRAWLGENVRLSDGVVICAGACLTTDIELSDHVHINLSATVGHDVEIGSFSTISPGANISGNVRLAEEVEIGTGASIIQRIPVGRASVIGAGAAVVREIPENSVAVGVPAKVIQTKSDPA